MSLNRRTSITFNYHDFLKDGYARQFTVAPGSLPTPNILDDNSNVGGVADLPAEGKAKLFFITEVVSTGGTIKYTNAQGVFTRSVVSGRTQFFHPLAGQRLEFASCSEVSGFILDL